MSEQIIPITLTSGQNAINISCDKIKISWPKLSGQYFFAVVIDRKTLSVVASEAITDLTTLPASIKKYDQNIGYLFLLVTHEGNNIKLPQGDFLTFLDKNGAGPGLAKLIQCANTMAESYGYYSYCLASTMGSDTGFENYTVSWGSDSIKNIFLPLKLQKFGDYYTLTNVFPT